MDVLEENMVVHIWFRLTCASCLTLPWSLPAEWQGGFVRDLYGDYRYSNIQLTLPCDGEYC